jgi:hypothetical protein
VSSTEVCIRSSSTKVCIRSLFPVHIMIVSQVCIGSLFPNLFIEGYQ